MTSDEDDVIESLRSLARWLDPGPQPDTEGRVAISSWCEAGDEAVEMVGEMACWDAKVLHQAVGPPIDNDDEAWPGRWILVIAAIRAEQTLPSAEQN